jgi:hypothetical protein
MTSSDLAAPLGRSLHSQMSPTLLTPATESDMRKLSCRL